MLLGCAQPVCWEWTTNIHFSGKFLFNLTTVFCDLVSQLCFVYFLPQNKQGLFWFLLHKKNEKKSNFSRKKLSEVLFLICFKIFVSFAKFYQAQHSSATLRLLFPNLAHSSFFLCFVWFFLSYICDSPLFLAFDALFFRAEVLKHFFTDS